MSTIVPKIKMSEKESANLNTDQSTVESVFQPVKDDSQASVICHSVSDSPESSTHQHQYRYSKWLSYHKLIV
jgi:hypothetical protein